MKGLGVWSTNQKGDLIQISIKDINVEEEKAIAASVRTRADQSRELLWKRINDTLNSNTYENGGEKK